MRQVLFWIPVNGLIGALPWQLGLCCSSSGCFCLGSGGRHRDPSAGRCSPSPWVCFCGSARKELPASLPIYGFGAMLFLAFVSCTWLAGVLSQREGIACERISGPVAVDLHQRHPGGTHPVHHPVSRTNFRRSCTTSPSGTAAWCFTAPSSAASIGFFLAHLDLPATSTASRAGSWSTSSPLHGPGALSRTGRLSAQRLLLWQRRLRALPGRFIFRCPARLDSNS